MPPRLPLIDRAITSVLRSPFICPSCRQELAYSSLSNSTGTQQYPKSRQRAAQSRATSTIASVTAVNAKRDIPPPLRRLRESLKSLENEAAVYVNTSQLQLALRGVESENAVTRVAVLGLNGLNGVRRLARVLLADPLAPESEWERQLTDHDDKDERAFLLRYGEQAKIDERHPLVKTLSVPSSILHTHNLEILIQATSSNSEPTKARATSFLVPELEMANSASGRIATVTYPVHKALVYDENFKNLASISTIARETVDNREDHMVMGVIDGSWNALQPGIGQDGPIIPVNLNLGEVAIEVFRKSLERSMEYEHAWFDSGMPTLLTWLIAGTEAQPSALKAPLRRLIQSICESLSRALLKEEESRLEQERVATIPVATKSVLDQGITIWAENAHTELRDGLNSAFNSKSWRKTKWWKLFWRVDDVGFIFSDVLQRAWLVEAEKEMIWISGRIHQSGLLGPPKLRPRTVPDPEDEKRLGGHPPAPRISDLVPQASFFERDEEKFVKHPWPQQISRARSAISSLTIAPLQALAQALLLQTISTSILASSLSALLYISISTTSPYESGAIAAVGIVYSLRRLQRRWEAAKGEWEFQIREEGRRVLRNAEQVAREAVRDGGRPEVDEVGIEASIIAKEAVRRVREALEELES